MQTFIEKVLSEIQEKKQITSDAIFVLPSKRAVSYLKKTLVKQSQTTYFAPTVISIEAFIENISGLKIIDNLYLVLSSYEVYLKTDAFKEKDSFEEFSNWILPVLNDFNEIDRYLIPKKEFFNYLLSIQTLEKWGVKYEQTPFVKNYLSFWESLETFYDHLNDALNNQLMGYQGMVYRKAAEDIEHYILVNGTKKHYFLGFNALNKAEQTIFQELLETGNTSVYWDMDSVLLEDKDHSASLFLRTYRNNWNYYKKNPITFIDSPLEKREITIVTAQNNIGQVKYAAQCISNLSKEMINNSAIVLADENLLLPLLYSLPKNISAVNVTMGLPLKELQEMQFFTALFELFLKPPPYYYKKIEVILLHPLAKLLYENSESIVNFIKTQNISYITYRDLESIVSKNSKEMLTLLFNSFSESGEEILNKFQIVVQKIRESNKLSFIENLVLKKLKDIFDHLKILHFQYPFIKSPDTLKAIFEQIVASEVIDFEGNPDQGLQIMGILETRVLDFENVIVLSVNEGTLPSGTSHSSFITHDLKIQFGLPLTPEKEAIYAYHFYHLFFRAKNCTFVYNGQAGGLNSGEKSRFLLQLDIEKRAEYNVVHHLQTATIKSRKKPLREVKKTTEILERLKEIGEKGFSPSALQSYLRNPMGFYFERILGIRETEILEETVAYNTLGTIVHQTLENLYKPFLNSELRIDALNDCIQKIEKEVTLQFKANFKMGDFSKGKNRIIFEVAKQYVLNLIKHDSDCLKKGNSIKIVALEEKVNTSVKLPESNLKVTLKGTVDRIDLFNNNLRIIDYKTGKVTQNELNIIDWEVLSTDGTFGKAFQVLAYAYMYHKNHPSASIQAGVISFKNLQSGFMAFQKKEASKGAGNSIITNEVLQKFEAELLKLILELLNPAIPFIEKEIK